MSITSYPEVVRLSGNGGNVVSFEGTTALDAFGRLRVSEPYTLFDSQNRYSADNQFDTSTSTGGSLTYLPNETSCSLTTSTSSGSEVVRQTFRTFPYQPGKSLLLLATFVMNEAKTNLRQRVGYFNVENGCYFEQDNSTLSFVIRTFTSGAVDNTNRVSQSQWNKDKLDGTGPSGITLNVTDTQILFMDFEWLGAGNVRCGFVIDGVFIVAHTFQHANQNTSHVVYMTTAILNVRYEITNTGVTASSSTLRQICSTLISEGGYSQMTADITARRTTALTGISTTFVPLISIRLNSSHLGAVILLNRSNVLPLTTQTYETVIVKNSVLTSPSWVTGTFQNIDYDVSATAMTIPTASSILQSDYLTSTSQGRQVLSAPTGYNFDYQLGASLAGVSDILTLGIRTTSPTPTADALGLLAFYDLTF